MPALRLARESLFLAQTEGLERLARWLGLRIPRNAVSERQYRAELVLQIQRAEKMLERAPKEKR